MTNEQIKQLEQVEQDNTTLNFDKWSFERRQAKLPADHSIWLQERDAVLARWQNRNDETQRKYLAGLEAEKAAKQAERDKQVDIELEPTKQTLMRGWLANNPNETAADFEKKAWIHLRENLIEQRKVDALSAEIIAARATGRYSL
jgi:hypothetical protein